MSKSGDNVQSIGNYIIKKIYKDLPEEEYIEYLCEQIQDEKTKKLVRYVLFDYLHKKQENKRKYFGYRVISIILSGAITALGSFTAKYDAVAYILTGVAAINTIIIGIETLFQRKDTWVRLSSTYEALKIETVKYVYSIGKDDALEDKRREEFIMKFLDICQSRVNYFKDIMTKQPTTSRLDNKETTNE